MMERQFLKINSVLIVSVTFRAINNDSMIVMATDSKLPCPRW